MTAQIVKFPFSVSRRAFARKPRASKNGTPEERAAGSSEKPDRRKGNLDHNGRNPLRSKFAVVSISVTMIGKIVYRRHGFDASTLSASERQEWSGVLSRGAAQARQIADEAEKAIEQLVAIDRSEGA